MTPKELLLATLKCKPTPRPAWIPFAGAYASRLKGYTATEMFQSADKLTECLLEVNRMFKPDGECCIFDLQIEAEVLGCDLMWADDGPPSVASHPLATEMGDTPVVPCECTLPGPNDGRIPLVCEAMRRVKKEIGDTTALYGLITGPFTLASHLRGTDIFLDMLLDDQFVHDLLDYCYKASFFVCGDATRNIEVMCKTGCDSISVDENVNFKPAKEICDKYSVAFGGNIPLTTIMLHGTQMDNMKYCVDLIDSIENKNGLIVATGCDMPYGVPFENTIGCMQAVLQTDEVREMVKDYVAEDDNDIEVELPDYEHLTKPLVEAFTLDPATCAACTYMVAATDEAKRTFGDAIDYNVYKYTVKEDIARMKKMGVPNLPSVYINGKMKFRSIIPSKDELEAAIREVM